MSLGIHTAQCNRGVLLCQEVKQQLLVRMAIAHGIDYVSGLPIVSSLDPDSLQDSQLRADGLTNCPGIDLTECYYLNLNLQYDVDITSSPPHITFAFDVSKVCP
jgi:hypothetical protein